jgi:hypothetical protein
VIPAGLSATTIRHARHHSRVAVGAGDLVRRGADRDLLGRRIGSTAITQWAAFQTAAAAPKHAPDDVPAGPTADSLSASVLATKRIRTGAPARPAGAQQEDQTRGRVSDLLLTIARHWTPIGLFTDHSVTREIAGGRCRGSWS